MKSTSIKKIEIINGRVRVGVDPGLERVSKTQQQFKDQCDVNKIVAKYKTTGQWLHLTGKRGVFADVSQIGDYHESLNKIQSANAAFAALPAELRLRFNNDPGKLLEFIQDPKNYDEGVKLGIFEPKKLDNVLDANKNDLNEISKPPAGQKSKKAQNPDSESKKLDEE